MGVVVAAKTVGWLVGRAGVYLMRVNWKRVTKWALAFGGVAVGWKGYTAIKDFSDDATEKIDDYKNVIVAAGAGIGIILLIVIISSYRRG